MQHPPMPPAEAASCANCGRPLAGPYCDACGQEVLPAPTVRSMVRHLLEVAEVNGRLVTTARGLLLRPGMVIGDWTRGRTVPYTGPFAFLSIAFAVAAFVVTALGIDFRGVGGAAIMLFLLPLVLTLAGRLVFLRNRRNLAAHLVANVYLLGEDLLLGAPVFMVQLLGGSVGRSIGNVGWILVLLGHTRGLAQAARGGWRGYLGATITVLIGLAALLFVARFGVMSIVALLTAALRALR